MRRLALIPARGGSRRLPRKNIREFAGRPIIAWSIEAARQSGLFSRIVVSTDDAEIGEVAGAWGADALARPLELADDAVGTQEVARQVVADLARTDEWYERVCVIYATAPLMLADDLRVGLEALDSAPEQIGYVMPVPDDPAPLSDPGQWYWCRTAALLRGWPLRGLRALTLPIPPGRVCDINTAEDLDRARGLFDRMVPHP